MCLLDTVDGALMMALYTSTAFAKDQIAILYYSIVLTIITVTVAMVIGLVQMLTLVRVFGARLPHPNFILSLETCLKVFYFSNLSHSSKIFLERAC